MTGRTNSVHSGVKPAYDLKTERRLASNQGFRTEIVNCWVKSSVIEYQWCRKKNHRRSTVAKVALKWLREQGFDPVAADFSVVRPRKRVKAIVYFCGDKWRIWEPQKVCRKLCPRGPSMQMIDVLVGYIGKIDLSLSARSPASDCNRFARFFLGEAAELYLQGIDAIPRFRSIFNRTHKVPARTPSLGAALAVAIHRAKYFAFDVLRHVRDWPASQAAAASDAKGDGVGGIYLNSARMLRHGCRIGVALSEARSALTAATWLPLVAKQRANRNSQSTRFWHWVTGIPRLQKKTAKEVLRELVGIKFETREITLNHEEGWVSLGHTKLCKITSFDSLLSRARKRRRDMGKAGKARTPSAKK